MAQTINIITIVLLSLIFSAAYADEIRKEYIIYFLLFGLFLIALGGLDVMVFHGKAYLKEGYMLKTMGVKYKFIFVGYAFMLQAIFTFIFKNMKRK